jgi:CheY-like chemotaxis protein
MLPRFNKTLLVCSECCEEVEKYLTRAGCSVTRVSNGYGAVHKIRRENFDAAVLVSTERDMDLAETAFTLRDISPSVQIIIVVDREDPEEGGLPRRSIAEVIPNTKALTVDGLRDHLLPPERGTGLEPAKEQKTSPRERET